MRTYREKKQQELFQLMETYDELVSVLNQKSRELGNETTFTHLRLYKEQKDQIEDIMTYFDEVKMPPNNNTVENILTMALHDFHQRLMKIK